mmetsp:Transcript_24320/g.41852  ORF Transcript_24320/g.41852 Transcript_24320/m.41852 type:complete len:210 (+) Transcript_24320:2079-2708(+)
MSAWSAYAHTPLRPYTSISCRPTRASFLVDLNRPRTPTSLPLRTNRSSMSLWPSPSVSPLTSTATGHIFGFSPLAEHSPSYVFFALDVSVLTRSMYSTKRLWSKLTFVNVENNPSKVKRLASTSSASRAGSMSPPGREDDRSTLALWRKNARTFTRWISRSCMAATSGVFPHTPTVVHPLPRKVCSHWKQNIFALAFAAATGTASSTTE